MKRELIVITRRPSGRQFTAESVMSFMASTATRLSELPVLKGTRIQPLFPFTTKILEDILPSRGLGQAAELPDLSVYFHVAAPEGQMDDLAPRLREIEDVASAYMKPASELPRRLNVMTPSVVPVPPTSPDFTMRQGYLDPAPGGIDARFAWTQPGGRGAGVNIVDVEGAWQLNHEDLQRNKGGVAGGKPIPDQSWRNHGTAVVGEFGGDRNTFGITGICPDAVIRMVSIYDGNDYISSRAIVAAANALTAGDIMLIELHRPGPRFNFQPRSDQRGYIAVEWWPDDFDAIRYAVARGVISVEAAGNGAENLDDPVYDAPAGGFPSDWTNPFKRSNRDSGVIVVGAGAPPPGTHGRATDPDRSRLDFSNYGALIDAQGWGLEVTTCGYGDLQGGPGENAWYTDQFGGTSSASPIVVGALGCVEGILRARGAATLTPSSARQLLRAKGSPQQDAPGRPRAQRIGNRPDLHEMISLTPRTSSSV